MKEYLAVLLNKYCDSRYGDLGNTNLRVLAESKENAKNKIEEWIKKKRSKDSNWDYKIHILQEFNTIETI